MNHQMGDVDNGGGYVYLGARDIQKISASSAQYCYEPKAALKKPPKYIFLRMWSGNMVT